MTRPLSIWELSAVLAPEVLEPWRPLLEMLISLTGKPAPARPEPVMRVTSWIESHGGLSADVFAARAAEEGPAAAAGQLINAPVERTDVDASGARAGLLSDLVAQDPQLWARDADGVAAVAVSDPTVLAAYFNSLHRAAREGKLAHGDLAPIALAVQQAHRTGQALADPVRAVLTRLLEGEPDDQALAVIGFCLGQLAHVDAAWVEEHADRLYTLDTPWRPATAWLRQGRPHTGVLARLDRAALLQAAAGQDGIPTLDKIILVFLASSEDLGPGPALLAELATQDGGPQAVSELLCRLAQAVIGCEEASPWPERAAALWRSALEAQLEPAALTGAGRFAYADRLDDAAWLELTARTVARQPDLEAPYAVAERAARHPHSADALLIAAAVLGVQVDPFHRREIQGHAARLFAQSTAEGTAEHEQLRIALINAGAIEAAYKDTPVGP